MWERHGQYRRSETKFAFHAFLQKHLAGLRPFVLTRGTAGAFADALDTLLSEKLPRKGLRPGPGAKRA